MDTDDDTPKAYQELSRAYVRLRTILQALNTPHAPSVREVWDHTEQVARDLKADVEFLKQERQKLMSENARQADQIKTLKKQVGLLDFKPEGS